MLDGSETGNEEKEDPETKKENRTKNNKPKSFRFNGFWGNANRSKRRAGKNHKTSRSLATGMQKSTEDEELQKEKEDFFTRRLVAPLKFNPMESSNGQPKDASGPPKFDDSQTKSNTRPRSNSTA